MKRVKFQIKIFIYVLFDVKPILQGKTTNQNDQLFIYPKTTTFLSIWFLISGSLV